MADTPNSNVTGYKVTPFSSPCYSYSVLGPILFTLYVSPVPDIANQHGVCYMLYADDTQLYINFDMNSMAESLKSLKHWIHSIKNEIIMD